MLRIGTYGKLSQVGADVKLPVATGVNPQGLAVLDVS